MEAPMDALSMCQSRRAAFVPAFIIITAFASAQDGLLDGRIQQMPDYVNGLAHADMNHDGFVDAVCATGTLTNNALQITTLAGGIVVSHHVAFSGANWVVDVRVADFNADSNLDIISFKDGASNFTQTFGDGNGGSANSLQYTAPGAVHDITTGDFNGDGHPDLLLSYGNCCNGGKLQLFRGTAGGALAAPVILSCGVFPFGVAAADFNLDGKLDILTTEKYKSLEGSPNTYPAGSRIFYMEGDGTSNFAAPVESPVDLGPERLLAVDYNSDGLPDAVTTNTYSGYTTVSGNVKAVSRHTVSFTTGSGQGTFENLNIQDVVGVPYRIASNDINHDGCADFIITTESDDYSELWYLGAANGGVSRIAVLGHTRSDVASLADVTNDGDTDTVIALVEPGTGGVTHGATNGFLTFVGGAGATGLKYTNILDEHSEAREFRMGDLNADGYPDIVSLRFGAKEVASRLSLAGDGFGGASTTAAEGDSLHDLALTDINNDGRLDALVLGSPNVSLAAYNLHFFVGAGDGTFAWNNKYILIPGGSGVNHLTRVVDAADLNFDGSPDAVVAGPDCFSLLNAGNFNFTLAQTFTITANLRSIRLADINEDSAVDIVTNECVRAFGNGDGTFGAPVNVISAIGVAVEIADFNNDDHLDICIPRQLPATQAGFYIMAGDGMGAFPTSVFNTFNDYMFAEICAADLNQDGFVDAAGRANTMYICNGNGDLTLGAPQTYFSGGMYPLINATNSNTLLAVDVDLDGRPDLAFTASDSASNIMILKNPTAPSAGIIVYGMGTHGCRGSIGVSSNSEPIVGNEQFALVATNGPRRGLGFYMIGDVANILGSDVFFLQLSVLVDPYLSSFLAGVEVITDRAGQVFAPFPIPNDNALHGFEAYAQFFFVEETADGMTCSLGLFDLVSSRGLHITIP